MEVPSFFPHNFSRNCGESGHEGAAGSWVFKALRAWMGSTSFSISLVFSHCSAAEMDLLPGFSMGFAVVTAFHAQGWVGHGWQHTDLSLTLWEFPSWAPQIRKFLCKESEPFCGASLRWLGQISRCVSFTCKSCSPCEGFMDLVSCRNGEGSALRANLSYTSKGNSQSGRKSICGAVS